MKYAKMLGLAVAAAALMAFVVAGTASATGLTGSGGSSLGVGTVIEATNESTVTLHPPIGDIECEMSSVSGTVTNAGGASATVSGQIDETLENGDPRGLTFTECNAEVTVLKAGTLEVHTRTANADGNGTLTSNGAEVTVTFIGFHCIFKTTNTDVGTVTGSEHTASGHATLDIEATIPRTGGRSGAFCGTTAQWTGSYQVSSPAVLNIH